MMWLISAVRIAFVALIAISQLYVTVAFALGTPASATQVRLNSKPSASQQITCNWWTCRPVLKGCRLARPYREHFGDPSNGIEVCKDGAGRHRLDAPS